METNKDQYTAPVKPYDESIGEQWTMYDHIPYVWDSDLNGTKRLARESGNIIKAYRCLIKEPYEVKH